MTRHNPSKLPLIAAVTLVIAVCGLFWRMEVSLLYAYLLSISLITFLFYGYDKRQAAKSGGRIPEVVLHLLALAGGTPGALAGQIFFRHKTRKLRFKIVFVLIVCVQALAAYLCWRYLWPLE